MSYLRRHFPLDLLAPSLSVFLILGACQANDGDGAEIDNPKLGEQQERPFDGEPFGEESLCLMFEAQRISQALCTTQTVGSAETLFVDNARICRAGSPGRLWAKSLLEAEAIGRLNIHWNNARECLEGTRALRESLPGIEVINDPTWLELVDGVCNEVYVGLTKNGEACADDWDCEADLGCYSENPTKADSLTCRPKAKAGQKCSNDFFPCEDGLVCSGACMPLIGPGGTCEMHDECLGGRCGGDPLTCNTFSTPRELGDRCFNDGECQNLCATCRPQTDGGLNFCLPRGQTGELCGGLNDCAEGLGCNQGVCGTVGEDEFCGVGPQTACEQGLSCVSLIDCESYEDDQQRCEETPDNWCAFSQVSNTCITNQGQCKALDTTGPCIFSRYCAAGAKCFIDSCVANVQEGASCSAQAGPDCESGLSCVGGECKYLCEVNNDCGVGTYCNTQLQPSQCIPKNPSNCFVSDECSENEFCSRCGAQNNEDACTQNDACSWEDTGYCNTTINCAQFDGNESSCLAQNSCGYNPDTGWCDPTELCSANAFAECTASEACTWNPTEFCADKEGSGGGSCEPKNDTGGACSNTGQVSPDGLGESPMCQSGYCLSTKEGDLCTVSPSGCNDRKGPIVEFLFLFGAFALLRRSPRRN